MCEVRKNKLTENYASPKCSNSLNGQGFVRRTLALSNKTNEKQLELENLFYFVFHLNLVEYKAGNQKNLITRT